MSPSTVLITFTALTANTRDASEKKNGKKLEDFDNVERSDVQERNANEYVQDPTTRIQRENGTSNDAYDYAEERFVSINAYKQKESNNDEDDSDGYEGYMEKNGAASATTKQGVTDLYTKQPLTADHKHDESSQQNSSLNQKNENTPEIQELPGESYVFKGIENEESYYVNQSPLNNCTDYENTIFNVNATEKEVTGLSNCVNVKSVNDMTAVNTNIINVTHAENVCIQSTTHVHFPNDKDSKSKKIDKKSKTW